MMPFCSASPPHCFACFSSSERSSLLLGWHRVKQLEERAVKMKADEAINAWQDAFKGLFSQGLL